MLLGVPTLVVPNTAFEYMRVYVVFATKLPEL